MQIWVDADACPNVIKEILFRAAERLQIHLIMVANTTLRTPPSPSVNFKKKSLAASDQILIERILFSVVMSILFVCIISLPPCQD